MKWAAYIAGCVLVSACAAQAQLFIGSLDGASAQSTFETGTLTSLPSFGWQVVAGSAQIADQFGGNGSLVGGTAYGNYEVQYDTGTPIQPNTTYQLQLQMGYIAALSDGASGYALQLGTVSGGVFTGLGTTATGTVPYTGNSLDPLQLSAPVVLNFVSGGSVSGDNLAVRWSQTSTLGSPKSDYFGIDNVRLVAVPEPQDYIAVAALALLGFGLVRRLS